MFSFSFFHPHWTKSNLFVQNREFFFLMVFFFQIFLQIFAVKTSSLISTISFTANLAYPLNYVVFDTYAYLVSSSLGRVSMLFSQLWLPITYSFFNMKWKFYDLAKLIQAFQLAEIYKIYFFLFYNFPVSNTILSGSEMKSSS